MRLITICFAVIAALTGIAPANAANPALSAEANKAFLDAYAQKPGVVVRPSGLRYRIIRGGNGNHPGPSDIVDVYYSGRLVNGTVFDPGPEPDTSPARFDLAHDGLIKGWIEALQLMRIGDHWEVVIPSNLGYGERGYSGVIPPNQTLIFDLELEATTPPPPDQKQQQDDNQ